MEEGFDDFIRRYFGKTGEQGNKEKPDFFNAVESCKSNREERCCNQDCDSLPCKSVEGVLKTMFQIGDHLEVFFEDERIGSGGTFVAVFNSILIWADYDGNTNITDLCGPISVRKMGTRKKKKQKHNNKSRNFNHKSDDHNDKKKKNKAEKREKGSRKKDGKSGVNGELLNFVKLEEGSQDPLILEQLDQDNETNEKENLTTEILDSPEIDGGDSVQGPLDEKEGNNHLYMEDSSSDSEAELTVLSEPDEVQTVEEEPDQDIEEKVIEYDSDFQDLLKDERNIQTTENHFDSTLIGDDTVAGQESDETLSIMEETSSEEDLGHSSIN
ncbi:hypothetical protein SAMN04487936_106210 [Halobacillus dabanensis]|uniref:Uncharacterized protein n=1 Tax=Halobacillus dabanensis TaxID=240302 RepID=A0A1I3W6S4_HALDA|nr:hypothetical protein [Halobacillus dabanensis]SFK02989.1 hypothetical protein SAMN04487936_106210 [Halobacillus dabanensis]